MSGTIDANVFTHDDIMWMAVPDTDCTAGLRLVPLRQTWDSASLCFAAATRRRGSARIPPQVLFRSRVRESGAYTGQSARTTYLEHWVWHTKEHQSTVQSETCYRVSLHTARRSWHRAFCLAGNLRFWMRRILVLWLYRINHSHDITCTTHQRSMLLLLIRKKISGVVRNAASLAFGRVGVGALLVFVWLSTADVSGAGSVASGTEPNRPPSSIIASSSTAAIGADNVVMVPSLVAFSEKWIFGELVG